MTKQKHESRQKRRMKGPRSTEEIGRKAKHRRGQFRGGLREGGRP